MMFDRRLFKNFDWLLIFIALLLCTIGLVLIYSATCDPLKNTNNLAIKQLYWVIIGIFVTFIIISIDYHKLALWSPLFYSMDIIILIYTLATKNTCMGVNRWLQIGGISIQPSEFMKFILILLLAQYLKSKKIDNIKIKESIVCLILTLIPLILIMKQPDLGTSMLLVPIFVASLFIAGISPFWIFSILGFGLGICPLLWFQLREYQKRRVLGFINPNLDPLGAGYQTIQSKIAIGSGGLWGKGFKNGTQCQLKFLPVHHTDFIFSVLAEEWGFWAVCSVLFLFLVFISRGINIAFKAKDRLGAIIAFTLVVMITSHIIINISMVLGIFPVAGIPLPLISYGGSSMITNFASIALLLNIKMRRFD